MIRRGRGVPTNQDREWWRLVGVVVIGVFARNSFDCTALVWPRTRCLVAGDIRLDRRVLGGGWLLAIPLVSFGEQDFRAWCGLGVKR
jgi:hypothetical protein